MPSETHAPSPGRDLVRIHRVITRGLATSTVKATEFKQSGFPEIIVRQGFCDYARSLATVLGGHHQVEDLVIFPTFQEKLPQGPYEHLAAQHRQIEALLVVTHQDVDEVNATGHDGLDSLLTHLGAITELWAPHIRMEESIFSHEALCEVMTQEEQTELSGRIGEFSQRVSGPPYLIIPFVLFNLDIDDRTAYLANMPGNVMDDLVMKAWKGQWAPMKAFLLD